MSNNAVQVPLTRESVMEATLDVVAQNLAVALRTALPETLAALATT